MKKKQFMAIALAGALAIGTFGFSVPVNAIGPDPITTTDYVLTIPATLNVENVGWNATSGITANNSTNNFDTGKYLTVTAISDNEWKLKAEGIEVPVGYNLAAATGTYSSEAAPASWKFLAADLNKADGTNSPMGVIVEDYTGKAAGSYSDTVTFTANVDDFVPVTNITLNKNTTTITAGQTETLSASSLTPADATDPSVTWSSSNTNVATANDGSGVTATCAVTVNKVVTITGADLPAESTFIDEEPIYTFTKDGITVTAPTMDIDDAMIMSNPEMDIEFSTTLGNFTSIEVSGSMITSGSGSGSLGWSGTYMQDNYQQKSWSGESTSVVYKGSFIGRDEGLTIICTIEAPTAIR